MFTSRINPVVMVGVRSEIPAAAESTIGDMYFATDTSDLFVLINVGGIRSWEPVN